MQVKAKDINQGQRTFSDFSMKSQNVGHLVMKYWFANNLWPNISDLQRQSFSKITGSTKIL